MLPQGCFPNTLSPVPNIQRQRGMLPVLARRSVSACSQASMVRDVDQLSLKPPQATEYCNLLSWQEFKLNDH